jgi:FKBP-type peptidyl-prolyl cis-trans isomerase SlpA
MDKIDVMDITAGAHQKHRDEGKLYDPDQVCNGREVTLHFELALADGDIVDSNFSGRPVTFRLGDGNLPPAFEEVIYGLRSGAEQTANVAADHAFGPHNPHNVQTFPRSRFAADLAMAAGLVINFTDQAGNEQAGVIMKCDASHVTVDFNHPLAGREIRFRVKILSVNS